VNEVAVDIQKAGAIVGFMRDMGIPDFIIERFGGHRSSPLRVENVVLGRQGSGAAL
jgi:hypothetical protein